MNLNVYYYIEDGEWWGGGGAKGVRSGNEGEGEGVQTCILSKHFSCQVVYKHFFHLSLIVC